MGLQEILDEIRKEAESERHDIVTQAKIEADKLVVKKLDDLSAVYQKKYDALDSETRRLTAKLRAKAELDVERKKQHAESELMDSLIRDTYAELSGNLRKDMGRYLDFLVRLTDKAVKQMPEAGEVGLSFRKEDESFFKDVQSRIRRDFRLLPDSKISGGVICICGEIYLDYSLDNVFRKLRPEMVRMLSDYFRD